MALTVEELQIVLSCDATTAQTVLRQMSATVKAYTDKFQSYFDKMGSGKGPKNLASDVKAIEKSIGPVKKALGDIQRNEYKVGKVLTTEQMAAQIAKNCAKATEETRNYFANSQAEYQRTVDKIADDNQLIGLGAKMRGMMEEATGSIIEMPDVLKYKVRETAQTIKQLSSEYAKSIAQNGENSKGSLAIKKKLEAAVVAADKLIERMRKIAAEQNKEPVQESIAPPPETESRWARVSSSISAARKRAHTFGVAVKKAFDHTLLGRFLNRLRMVMMRMAAMALIRGVINGTKQGLQELAKASESSAKAMNTIKAASGSIKMALGAALMPIVKALAPVFVSLAGAISSAANALARFFAVVTGQSTYTAVNFSGALDGITSSAGGAGKAVHGMLAEFDELIVIGNKAGGGGGGGSGVEQSLSTVGDLPAVSALATRIRESIQSGDWTGVGKALNECLHNVNKKFDEWLTNIGEMNLGKKVADILKGFFSPDENGEYTTFKEAGENVGKALGVIITFVADFFENFPYEDVWGAIVAFVDGLAEEIDRAMKEKFGEGPYWKTAFNWLFEGAGEEPEKPINPNQLTEDAHEQLETNTNTRKEIQKWLEDNIGRPIYEFVAGLNIFEWIDEKISDVDVWLGELFGDPAEQIIADLGVMWDDTKTSLEEAWAFFKQGWQNIGEDIMAIGDIINASFGIAGEYVGAFFTTLIDFIAARGEIISGNVQRFILNIKASVLEGLAGLVDNLANGPMGRLLQLIGVDLGNAAQSLRDKAAEARDNIGEIDTKIADAQARAANGFDISANVNTSKVDALKTKINEAKSAISNTSSAVGGLSDKLNNIPSTRQCTVTIKVNTQGGTNTSSGGVTVNRPSVNLNLTHLATGGIAFGPAAALIGEYAGAKSNPEVVAPLSDLVGILSQVGAANGNQTSEEEMRLLREQNNLLRQIAQKELKLSPSTQLGQVVERSRQLYART